MLTEIADSIVGKLRGCLLREHDLATVGCRQQPGAPIEGRTEVVTAPRFHLAHIDRHPHGGDPILQTSLHLLCHRHRLSDGRERDQGAVPRLA